MRVLREIQRRSEPTDLVPRPPLRTTRGHLNDLTVGLGQQMFFWGRDVLKGDNLLLRYGFEKRPSAGLQGTSCYCKPWRHGIIELHGACAGWYPSQLGDHGFLFIRSDKRCYTHQETQPAIPGRYDYTKLTSGNLTRLTESSRVFIEWLVHYEAWVQNQLGFDYRQGCFEMFAHLPTSRPWLPPTTALNWLRLFSQPDSPLPRAREWMKNPSS